MYKVAGIDFSINHPSICIYDQKDKTCNFKVFPKEKTKGHKNLQYVDIVDVKRFDVENGMDVSDRERLLTINAIILADSIINYLPNDLDAIGLENMAFSASSNRLAEISGYQYILRERIINKYGTQKLYFYAANSVKATAGSGRFDKNQMIDSFINSLNEDVEIPLQKYLIDNIEIFRKTKNWIKPIDDIADSFWVSKCVLKSLDI
jgi:hypothetical protein